MVHRCLNPECQPKVGRERGRGGRRRGGSRGRRGGEGEGITIRRGEERTYTLTLLPSEVKAMDSAVATLDFPTPATT